MDVTMRAQAAVDKVDYPRGNGEPEAFAASALRQDKSVDAENRAVHVDQRAAAVARVDGSVSLNVGDRFGGVGLAGERADHAHSDGILQAFGTADGEDELSHMRALRADEGKSRQFGLVNLEQREIRLLMLA